MEWKEVNICDLCDTISETYKRGKKEVVLVNTSDVLEGKCLNHVFTPNINLKGQFKKTFKKNDILFSEIRPINKRFCYVDFDSHDYIASTKLMVLRAKKDVNPIFLYQILRSEDVLKRLQVLAESRSGTFPQITYSEMANIKLLLPSLEEQNKIVAILSSLDAKIENNNKINANLEAQAQALFKSWFVDFEPFQNGEFQDSELGRIPKGWKVEKAENVYEINIGKTPPRKEHEWFSEIKRDNIWVSIADMGNCGVFIDSSSEFLTDEAIKKFNILLVPKNTILVSFKMTIGRVCIADNILTTNEAIARFIIPSIEFLEFTYLQLKNYKYEGLGSTSSIAIAVNSKIIKAMPLLLPPEDIIYKFHKIVSPMFENIRALQKQNKTLSLLRDILLPKLMSGEIEV